MKKEGMYKRIAYFLLILLISAGLSLSLMISLNKRDSWGITGYAISGNVTISIVTTVHMNLSDSIVDFGVGTVNGSECIIDTKTRTKEGCTGFDIPNITLENLGNIYGNLAINVSNNHTIFWGKSNGNFSWTAHNTTEPGSCQEWAITEGNFYSIKDPGGLQEESVCQNFSSGDNNIINLDFKLVIPAATINSTRRNNMSLRLVNTASNNTSTKKLNITICINEISQLNRTTIADITINTSELFTLDINAANETILPVNFSDNTSLFDINSTTGLINFTPAYGDITKLHTVNISLDSGVCPGIEDSVTFSLTVRCKNHFPLLEVPDLAFTENTLAVVDISQYVTDSENSPLRYTYQIGLSMTGSGTNNRLLVYEPSDSDVGSHTLKITATELDSPPASPPLCTVPLSNSTNITVTVINVNDAPFFPFFVTTLTAEYDVLSSINITARDVDQNEQLTFSTNTSWFNLNTSTISTVNGNATAWANFTRNISYLGQSFAVRVNVTDLSNLVNYTDLLITIVEKNYAPNITSFSPANQTPAKTEGTSQRFEITKNDTNRGSLTTIWYLDGILQTSTVDTYPFSADNFTHEFSYSSAGNRTFQVIVSDGNLTASLTWNITVLDAEPPTTPLSGGGGQGSAGGGGTICIEKWGCTDWSQCEAVGMQKRECIDVNKCGTIRNKPEETSLCTYTGLPSCNDRVKNGKEEGVDCGGKCKPCPTCLDGIQNQGEEGIDCGGPCEQKCKYYHEDLVSPSKCGDGIAETGEIFSCPNDSWSFWVMMPMLFFLVSRIGLVLGVFNIAAKKRKRGLVFSAMQKAGVVKTKEAK